MLEIEIVWPQELSVISLRRLILDRINEYGQPLRWAITEVKPPNEFFPSRQVRVEATLIVNQNDF